VSKISKIFEKVLEFKLQEYLEANNLLSSSQYGFRPKRGTDQSIIKVTETIYSALHNDRKCATVYSDLTKALDTVDRDILLSKLHNFGIDNSASKCLQSYLTDSITHSLK